LRATAKFPSKLEGVGVVDSALAKIKVFNMKYEFNINPGLTVRNAHITSDIITVDESIFSRGQIQIVEKLLQSERERLEAEFSQTLESETKSAWDNGNEAGVIQTKNEMTSQVVEIIEQLNHVLDGIVLQTDNFLQHHESEILNLIIKIARKVIDVEVSINPDIVLQSFKRCLEFLNDKEEIKIICNPDDLNIIRANLSKLSLNIDLPKKVDFVTSEDINPGGCRIDFRAGSIDAEIDTQFAEIRRNILLTSENTKTTVTDDE
jgi:flagellar assembly protein FliH